MLGYLYLAGIVVIGIVLLKISTKPKGDIQKYRQEYYWAAIDSIVETDDETHADLVDFINHEVYKELDYLLNGIASDANNSKTFDGFKSTLASRKKQLDSNYNLYRKKVARGEQV